MEKNQTLTTINLAHNSIGADGARALATVLEKNKTLTTIGLGSNRIRADGAQALAAALEKNHTLTTLDLESNFIIGADGTEAWEFILRRCGDNAKRKLSTAAHEMKDKIQGSEMNEQTKQLFQSVIEKAVHVGESKIQETYSKPSHPENIQEIKMEDVLPAVAADMIQVKEQLEQFKKIMVFMNKENQELKARLEQLEKK